LGFVSGEPHPLAEKPNLTIDFPGPSSPHHMRLQITGDHVLLSCNGSPNDERQVDVLFLVDWKRGKVISVGILIERASYMVQPESISYAIRHHRR
jgi:hypothetical protein